MKTVDRFENSVQLRLRAEAQGAPSPDVLRNRVLSRLQEPARRRPSRLHGFVPVLAAFAVLAVLGTGLVFSRLLDDSISDNGAPPATQASSGQPPAASGADELTAATEQLLAASRAGDVPQITFVRNESDLSGLVVAVPQETLDQYGAVRLEETFRHVAHVPTTIEVAELPNDGLPIPPSD